MSDIDVARRFGGRYRKVAISSQPAEIYPARVNFAQISCCAAPDCPSEVLTDNVFSCVCRSYGLSLYEVLKGILKAIVSLNPNSTSTVVGCPDCPSSDASNLANVAPSTCFLRPAAFTISITDGEM